MTDHADHVDRDLRRWKTGGIVPRGITVTINSGYVVPPSYFDNPAIRVEITRGS